jgi:hypothetical protein
MSSYICILRKQLKNCTCCVCWNISVRPAVRLGRITSGSMAILSPTIRRSLYRILTQQSPLSSSNALVVGRRVGFSGRSIHSTCVLSGDALDMADTFSRRHGKHIFIFVAAALHQSSNTSYNHFCTVGPNDEDAKLMLQSIGFNSLDELIKSTIPSNIMSPRPLNLQPPMTESEALSAIKGKVVAMHFVIHRDMYKPFLNVIFI